VVDQYPTARWLFLTLTVKNCEMRVLKATLRAMNEAFRRLRVRQEFKHVLGFIRTTEVTRGKHGDAHPHFHTLLMVQPSYFSHGYVKKERWTEVWQEVARLDYMPVVDVRTVKPKQGQEEGENLEAADFLRAAVSETLKYAVKPADMVSDPDWFLELNRQLFKSRFIATGGVLKNVLRENEESQADFLEAEEEDRTNEDGKKLAFDWKPKVKRYRRNPKADK
jgi:plasmid rolling circle replication initiator protein Rep